MTHKPKFKIGDQFRLKVPRCVIRVGYPLDVVGAQHKLADDYWKVEAIVAILQDREIPDRKPPLPFKKRGGGYTDGGSPNKLCRELGTAALYIWGFGGTTRSLHYEYDQERFEKTIYTVHGKRQVQTGEYFAPSGGQHYDGEYWSEPGGLNDKKFHTLLNAYSEELSGRLEFDQDDCEKIVDQ